MRALLFFLISSASVAQAGPADRTYEGDWYVSDSTNNNTGEREVYAFATHLEKNDPDYVTLTMRCSKGKPTLFVDWYKVTFPDQTVLTIGPVSDPDAEPAEQRYVFERSDDVLERGLRATPETSTKIIAALARSKYATLTAHLTPRPRMVGINVNGTQGAWSRVSRHCPVRIMPQPPL